MTKKNAIGLLLLIICTSFLLWLRYPAIFAQPDQYINLYGDGFKNYATVVYHVKHDSTYLWYEGMNYPWGEHLVFADGQPLIANTIKFISQNISDISDHTVAILNLSMLFSMLLAAIFLYLLFAKLRVVWWYNLLVSSSLVMMARQTEKITGHYGLSHVFVVPLVLYLLYWFEKKPSYLLSLGIGICIFLVAQLHFYFFGISIFLIAFYCLFRLLKDFSIARIFFYFQHLFLQIILPFGLLQYLLAIGHPVKDRPNTPTGFLDYATRWEGVFTSTKFPFWKWIDENISGIRQIPTEGVSYVGMVATVFLLVILIRWLVVFISSKARKTTLLPAMRSADKDYIPALCFASFALLVLAHAFPFSIPGWEGLLQYAGPYKQFRGVGRFTWAFYFGFNIVVFYTLWWWSKGHYLGDNIELSSKSKTTRKVILFIALSVMIYEAYHFTTLKKVVTKTRPELAKDFVDQPDSWLKYVNLNRYQAVLPLPYYHIGSENFQVEEKGHMLRHSLVPGLNSGIPNLGVMMSRTSLSQSLKSLQLALEPYRYPKLLGELKNDKPLLLVEDKEYARRWKGRFDHLRDGATLLQEDEKNVAVYELPLSSFETRIEQRKAQIIKEIEVDSLFENQDFLVDQDSVAFLYVDYNREDPGATYLGEGGKSGDIATENVLYYGKLPMIDRHKFTLSLWMKLNEDQFARSIVSIQEIDPVTGKKLREQRFSYRFEIKVIDGNWGLFEKTVHFSDPNVEVKIVVQNKNINPQTVYVDELLLRPKHVDIYKKTEQYIWKNNRWFPR